MNGQPNRQKSFYDNYIIKIWNHINVGMGLLLLDRRVDFSVVFDYRLLQHPKAEKMFSAIYLLL